MTIEPILRLYLPDGLRRTVAAGRHNFFGKVLRAVEARGFTTELLSDTRDERMKAARRDGYALFHMHEATHDAAVSVRRAYFYPFWHIENMSWRWDYHVARSEFHPESHDPDIAETFVRRLRGRVFADIGPPEKTKGFIYMPLQGRLLDHRSFQLCAPIEMIRETLRATSLRPIIVTLHPNEVYSEPERAALNALIAENDRLTLGTKPFGSYLKSCDFVVTQNSSIAFSGYVFHKPCVLFGKSDFHHIAASAYQQGVAEAFQQVRQDRPNFDTYLYWFLKKMTVDAGHAMADEQIIETLQRLGWHI